MKTPPALLLLALVACLIFTAVPICKAEPNQLRINCTLHSPYEIFFFRLVEEVCAQNGIKVERNTPPVGRSLINVNQGIDDGDGPRIAGLSSAYPNLIQVSEPFGVFIFGAFSKNKNLKAGKWSDLAGLNVAYVHGWKIFDQKVEHYKSLTKVKNKELLFELLAKDRADVVLMTKLAGWATARKMGLKDLVFIEPGLETTPNYLYLHERHRDLAAKLADTLALFKQNGHYDRLYQEMILPHLPH